jgi:hypothetical protein
MRKTQPPFIKPTAGLDASSVQAADLPCLVDNISRRNEKTTGSWLKEALVKALKQPFVC